MEIFRIRTSARCFEYFSYSHRRQSSFSNYGRQRQHLQTPYVRLLLDSRPCITIPPHISTREGLISIFFLTQKRGLLFPHSRPLLEKGRESPLALIAATTREADTIDSAFSRNFSHGREKKKKLFQLKAALFLQVVRASVSVLPSSTKP